jgi:hypothetical protein
LNAVTKYKYADFSIWFTAFAVCFICCFFTWQKSDLVNFIGGDARYYYIYLQSTFINPAFINYDWLNPSSGVVITHHPVGFSILVLPFFLFGLLFANFLNYPLDGSSAPFQASISMAGIFYLVLGLIYLKKLLTINHVSDKIIAFVIVLVFFGTTLFHYTLNECGMSHVYSFSLISIFLYHSCKLVQNYNSQSLYSAAALFGLILLLRPNNALILFSVFCWFGSTPHAVTFFKQLLRKKSFYYSVLIVLLIAAIQPLTWLWKEDSLFVNRYASYGFYWTKPHLLEMLFGFEAGFFIYAPLCLLFLFGLPVLFKENKFQFYATLAFVLILFYIFASYSAYTYFDGLGIRVLVDYYSVFAFIGAKLFMHLSQYKFLFNVFSTFALILVIVNLIYCYQAENNILARSGMNFNKWKYVFLRTGKSYENSLGGSSDLQPFSKFKPKAALEQNLPFEQGFDFSGNEYGPTVHFNRLGFDSKRIQLKIKIRRKEKQLNSSDAALVCAMLDNKIDPTRKKYLQFRLNEVPALSCCENKEYNYTSTIEGKFAASDYLSVYLWNQKKQNFTIDEFSVQVYNFNYQ